MSATMFRAIVWKELRANLMWAVVVLIGMAAWLIYRMRLLTDPYLLEAPDPDRVIYDLQGTAAVAAILGGLLIGAAQALAENRGDQWGFLIHRPVNRSALFGGKASAGILLYAIATGAPVVAILSRIATPGYLPVPFDWRIALPVVTNLLCGVVFYFAGFLTGMRQARWYASRALGIGAAVACLIAQATIATTLWQALAVCIAGMLVVGTAAWGTFVAGGLYGAQPRIGRLATGLSIGLGMAVVAGVLLLISLQALPEREAPRGIRISRYTVTTDGKFVRITSGRNLIEVSDLDGRPLEQYGVSVLNEGLSQGVASVRLSPAMQRSAPAFQSVRRLFTQLRAADYHSALPVGDHPSSLSWHYVHRLGLIVAHDSQSRKLVGWLGPDGFSPYETRPRPFTGRLRSPRVSQDASQALLVFDDAVFRVDLEARRVEKIFAPEPAETVLDAGMTKSSPPVLQRFGEMAPFEVIATSRRVIVRLLDGTQLLEAPRDEAASGYSDLQVSRALLAPSVPTFLWYQGLAGAGHVTEFSSAGTVVDSRTIPSTENVPQESLPRIVIISAATALIGALADAGGAAQGSESPHTGTVRWTAAMLSSLIFAAAAFLHGRRHAFAPGRLGAWTAISLLLGPLGYLMMLALIEWPARESCPACHRKRVVTREHCEHCGAPFEAPPQDGTEIFEPVPGRSS